MDVWDARFANAKVADTSGRRGLSKGCSYRGGRYSPIMAAQPVAQRASARLRKHRVAITSEWADFSGSTDACSVIKTKNANTMGENDIAY